MSQVFKIRPQSVVIGHMSYGVFSLLFIKSRFMITLYLDNEIRTPTRHLSST